MPKVFIVDDEPFIHQLYKDILEFNGFEIVGQAYDGEEAVEMYSSMEEKPDIIIMDHRMPNKDGVDATLQIIEKDPDVKIIFASADSTVRARAVEAGAVEFLCKPFQIKELVESIKKFV
ncbi:MAG: two-component system response regulator [Thermoplasmata archaeon]|nr:MAG: two-component system response regulator [Thermoplasmata archaeon]RLF68662.1 MAG: two-component system response regulator [Thermoplasmata archaeon]HHD16631.1 response regulator [Euryarchaeota archaeon]